MRVLIVDDSVFMRKAIRTMLESDPAIEVVGDAKNGVEGIEKCQALKPDLITLDIEMPVMDGLTALRLIMKECPTHVIMLSSLTTAGSVSALKALSYGAADVLAKDHSTFSANIMQIKNELVLRVKAICSTPCRRAARSTKAANIHTHSAPSSATATADITAALSSFAPGRFRLVCIGSSTGGPPVLEKILSEIPANFPMPVLVAQHMPEVFTRSMSQRLDGMCAVPVRHIEEFAILKPGSVYISPGGKNAHLRRADSGGLAVIANREPEDTIFWPSVDVMLDSAAKIAGKKALGIILTGLGEDGYKGAKALRDAGGVVLAQNEATCVVYGMRALS